MIIKCNDCGWENPEFLRKDMMVLATHIMNLENKFLNLSLNMVENYDNKMDLINGLLDSIYMLNTYKWHTYDEYNLSEDKTCPRCGSKNLKIVD